MPLSMNEEKHWDNIADKYSTEVLNVYEADVKRKIQRAIQKYGGKNALAVDFGCGVGNGFPYLSKNFKKILALDISSECLSIARSRGFLNINCKKADLTSSRLKLPVADFGICINVLLLPDVNQNRKIIRNINKALKRGGHAVFVVPAFESILHTGWNLIEWNNKEGVKANDISPSELSAFKASKPALLQGIIDIMGVPTKHYLQTELQVLFREAGFDIIKIDKIEYNWESEFNNPPGWMQEPFPWDWLLTCKKL